MSKYVRTYTVVLEPITGGWRGYCLELPNCIGQGVGKIGAYKAVKEKIRAHLFDRLLRKQKIPNPQVAVKQPRFDLRDFTKRVTTLR
ncbi:MAG: hypothetical protein GY764_12275 [Halieaceae bacterium]|nr:hypothetical protein [Halieaceae bacterium]